MDTMLLDTLGQFKKKCKLKIKKHYTGEYHYMVICKRFSEERSTFIPKRCFQKPSVAKFCELLATNSKNMLFKVAKFAKIIMLQVDSS